MKKASNHKINRTENTAVFSPNTSAGRESRVAAGYQAVKSNMKIKPYQQKGAWVSSYIEYYRFAWLSYDDFSRIVRELEDYEKKLFANYEFEDRSTQNSYVHHMTGNHVSEAYRFAESTILFSALTIEGFLNDYGLKRIGLNLYNELIERKSPTKKFKLIWQICFEEKIKNDNKGLQAVRKLF